MKLVKSLLLGSAAGLFAVAGAQAADLPVKKAAPVDYVRVCSTYGTGYWFIPGTDTCLRISGYLRADYLYLEPFRRDFDATGFRARGRINFDVRQATEYGLLRAFVRYQIQRSTGAFVGRGQGGLTAAGSVAAGGASLDPETLELSGISRADPFLGTQPTFVAELDQGYIQFGGLTAGRVQSFYDFFANDDIFTTLLSASDTKNEVLAYTATFGGGWSATIAIEDGTERRAIALPRPGSIGGEFVAVDPLQLAPQAYTPAGQMMPDVVGNIRLDQSWGAFQLSGALHQLRATNILVRDRDGEFGVRLPGDVDVDFEEPIGHPDNEIGYAIQAGVRFNLPMIAAGDQLWLQASFASGALGYTNVDDFTAARAGTIRLNQSEAVIDPVTGDIERTDSWSVSGKFLHYWLPNLRSNFFGGYSEIDYDASANRAFISPEGLIVNAGFQDTRIYEAGANLIWSPVKGLDIGVEGVYRKIDPKGRVREEFGPLLTQQGTGDRPDPRFFSRNSEDAWEARLRIQRDF